MNIFKLLLSQDKKEVIDCGKSYAVDKTGFVKFAEKKWKKGEYDYLCALVAAAKLIIDRPRLSSPYQLIHQLHLIDYAYARDNDGKERLIADLNNFFAKEKLDKNWAGESTEIEEAYLKKREIYSLHAFLSELNPNATQAVERILEDVKADDQYRVKRFKEIKRYENKITKVNHKKDHISSYVESDLDNYRE